MKTLTPKTLNLAEATIRRMSRSDGESSFATVARVILDRLTLAALALLGYEAVAPGRMVLPMSSGVNILPNTSAQITSRPQTCAFRPERLVIGGTPADWVVNDIKVGNRSQLAQSGDVPGELFSFNASDNLVAFDTVQTAMDFVMTVTYVGSEKDGAPFACGVLGTATI